MAMTTATRFFMLIAIGLIVSDCYGVQGANQGKSAKAPPLKDKDHCYALVLGGGGARGAYEAGVLWGLLHNTDDKSKYAYDVISGVSAGSINGAALAVFEPGDEINAVEVLSQVWQALTTGDIFKNWFPLGIVQGLNELGLVDQSPLRAFVENFFDEHGYEFKRLVSFLGVDGVTGNTEIFNETLSDTDKLNGIMTSSAIPFVFVSQHWNYEGRDIVGLDGGTVWMFDVAGALKRCQEVVDDDSKITVDVVGCFAAEQPPYTEWQKRQTVDNWNRFLEIKQYYQGASNLVEVMAAFPKVNFRHYIWPTQFLPIMSVLDGTNATCTWPMQEIGRLDAKAALEKEGVIFSKMQEYLDSEDLKRRWPRVAEYIDHIRNTVVGKANYGIDISCDLSLFEEQAQNVGANNSTGPPDDVILQK